MSTIWRVDRSYAWNYTHAPQLPRVRRMPHGPGARFAGYPLNSPLGIAAGPLLNSRWVEGYARLGFDILTYATVRTRPQPALTLPNIRPIENREQAAVAARRTATSNGDTSLAVSLGLPSMEPEVWRKDMRRARERLGQGQVLVASVVGTPDMIAGVDAFIADYAQCAAWAAEAGAHVIEVHLAVPNPFGEPGQMVYEHIPLSAQILYSVRTAVTVPVIAKLGLFRGARLLHDTATKLAPWVDGFELVSAIPRKVIDEEGNAAFEGTGREWAEVVGAATYPMASRQVEEMLAWRKAGEWPHAVVGVGGITTIERARHLLREGANVALIATAALVDPQFGVRFRQAVASAVAVA